jgi:hypothetical protein
MALARASPTTPDDTIISRGCGRLGGLIGFLLRHCRGVRATPRHLSRVATARGQGFAVAASSAIIAAISAAARGMMAAWPPSAEE